ncbi:hypothetical protein [Flavihumibacter petaseus]|uniref:Uncharacterized protein n=1 Tax=Flavihumibacter petaseus NBRC 106054 TaxID=1220578 RepID=A0A0E9N630_9BACT|nr:hypothetical protein [Flavihumibacter petaseus]GAO45377.1 hypothetical protein FPE01S_05_00740 [Flavihumibacter petaseus NBRC 106054]
MHNIGGITNPDKLVEKKVNYFLDKLVEFTLYAGTQKLLEIESPPSLVGKIIFQIECNTAHKIGYLDYYFSNIFFLKKDYWTKYEAFNEVIKSVEAYRLLGKGKKDEKCVIVENREFIIQLKELEAKLKANMVDDLIFAVCNNSLCDHELYDPIPDGIGNHAESFAAAATMLGSEFLFRGYGLSEIDDIIGNVFSRDINKFPFSPDIETESDKRTFMKTRSLRQQLMGFANVFKVEPSTGIAFIRVYGGIFPDDFVFKYNKVRFLGKSHPDILELAKKDKDSDWYNFFSDDNFILAETSVTWVSKQSLFRTMLHIIQNELGFLSAKLGRILVADNSNNILVLNNDRSFLGKHWALQDYGSKFEWRLIEDLKDNAFEALRNCDGAAKTWFLGFEHLFVEAHKDRSVADYWIYLEILLSGNERNGKRVREIFSSLLILTERKTSKKRVLIRLMNFLNSNETLTLVSTERRREVQKELLNGIIPLEFINVDYPYIKELMTEFNSELTVKDYVKAREYYNGIALETYEYRNFAMHSGVSHRAANIKLINTLSSLVVRFRQSIFEAIHKKGSEISFQELIEELVKKGEAMTKQE